MASAASRGDAKAAVKAVTATGWTQLPLELFPKRTLHLCLLHNVANSADVLQHIIKQELNAAVMDAGMVACTMAVRSAAHKALAAESRGALISASLHAEVVYDLGPYRGVAQALRKFGIGKGSTDVLVAVIDASSNAVLADVQSKFDATVGRVEELDEPLSADKAAALQQVFNITDEELVLPSTSLQEAVVERMALKEVLPGNQGKPPKQKKQKKASKKKQQSAQKKK